MGFYPFMRSNFDNETGEDAVRFDPFVPPALEELNALIPDYEFIQFIDQGGMGAVYKAIQKSLNRVVAVKLLPLVHRNKQRFAERFAREGRALALLNHPHIVSVYDSGESKDGHMYYAMEYVVGTDLQNLLRRENLSPKQILNIVTQVCEALQFAHDQGVVHRDVKPANILIDERGNVKVADFGLAKVIGRSGTSSFTATGATMGTPDYIAPEAASHETVTDHRADIYSLGVMIYEMLTGQVPKGVWEPPSKRAGVDARLDDVVNKAMQSDPEKRYQHVSDMTQIIQKLLATGDKLAGFDRPRPPTPARKPAGPSAEAPTVSIGDRTRTSTRRTAAITSIAVTLAVVAAGLLVAKQQGWLPGSSPPPPGIPSDPITGPAAAPAEQIKLAAWVFDHGGFVNVMGPGQSERLMGDSADLHSARELPPGAFSVWRISMSDAPLPDDKALDELISLSRAAGTVANLNLRGANVTPSGLKSLSQLETLASLDLASSPAITEASVPHIGACKNLKLLKIGGAGASDVNRISQMLRSLNPECEIEIE